MAFQANGTVCNRALIYGQSTDDINTAPKIQSCILYLTDTEVYKTYDRTVGWIDYTGDPISLSNSTGSISMTNPLPMKEAFYSATPVTIYNAISATPVTQYELVVNNTVKGLKIQTSGTSTSRTINFKAKTSATSTAVPFCSFNCTTADFVATTTAIGEIWDISGFDGIYSVIIEVTAIAGGNLTIVGNILS